MDRASPDQVRALAHPLRLRMLELLREGPSTASRLARAVGESSGATSYHLRALAKAGLVEEDTDRGNGRDRWWRRPTKLIFIPTSSEDTEVRAAEMLLRSVLLERDEEAIRRFIEGEESLDGAWQEGAFVGGWYAWATPEEADAFGQRVTELVDELRRAPEDRPPGARQVYVTFRAIPWLEPE